MAITVTLGATLLMCFYAMHSSYVSSLAYSSPSIVIEAGRTRSGQRILYDDYREAYYWLRHNTDPDAKIMSWWDYGYQVRKEKTKRARGRVLVCCLSQCLDHILCIAFEMEHRSYLY